jgi:hypothetical protein
MPIFIPTTNGSFIPMADIVEIKPASEKTSEVRTKNDSTHIVEMECYELAGRSSLQQITVIPAGPGYKVIEAIFDEETKKWGTTEVEVIGWASIEACPRSYDLFRSKPVTAGPFFTIGPWALVYPDGQVATEHVMYYTDVAAWLKDVKKYGKNRNTL